MMQWNAEKKKDVIIVNKCGGAIPKAPGRGSGCGDTQRATKFSLVPSAADHLDLLPKNAQASLLK